MEVKVEKGQFKWKVLNLLFWGFVALTFPTILFAFNFFIDNLPIFITGGVIASIFFNICIFLQKNWPIDRRVQAALYTTICLYVYFYKKIGLLTEECRPPYILQFALYSR